MTKEIYVSTDLDDRGNLPDRIPDASCMTQEQLDKELEKGYAELQERRIRPAEEVFEDIHERYGV